MKLKIQKCRSLQNERIITSPQSSVINTKNQKNIINLCSNNYLGLSSDPSVLKAAKNQLTPMDMVCHLLDLFVEHRIFIKA